MAAYVVVAAFVQYVVPPLVGSVPGYIVLIVPLFGGTVAPLHTVGIWRARAAEAFTLLASAHAATAAAAAAGAAGAPPAHAGPAAAGAGGSERPRPVRSASADAMRQRARAMRGVRAAATRRCCRERPDDERATR